MTNKQILKKVIQKAIDNGWRDGKFWLNDITDTLLRDRYSVIFNHNFAKTFWGKKEVCPGCARELKNEDCCEKCRIDFEEYPHIIPEAWQYHLQQLVLEKDHIKYLSKFI